MRSRIIFYLLLIGWSVGVGKERLFAREQIAGGDEKTDTAFLKKGEALPGKEILPEPQIFNYKNVRDYIFTHLNYPPQAIAAEVEGTVVVSFVINREGVIDSVGVVTPVHPLLDAEAVRLMESMPRWKPVYRQGAPVVLYYEVPVIFELLPPDTTALPDKVYLPFKKEE